MEANDIKFFLYCFVLFCFETFVLFFEKMLVKLTLV